jgi:hypothetical protein
MKTKRYSIRCDGTGLVPDYADQEGQCPTCSFPINPENLRRDGTIRPHGTWWLAAVE